MKTLPDPQVPDFSLVLGGPLFQLYRRSRLADEGLRLVSRRVLGFILIAWLPLLVLSALDGHLWGGGVQIPFLYDIEAHVRFLVALPLLVLAEIEVHQRIGPVLRQFVSERIVRSEDVDQFNAAVEATLRVRNSVMVEVVMLVFVYAVTLASWRTQFRLDTATWFSLPDAAQVHLTPAGLWYAFVSIPIVRFLLLRWYMRFALWFSLLFRITRLNLRLSAAHPDRAGGLNFLGRSSYIFGPVLFAQGALLAGAIASRIFFEGKTLISFKFEAAGLVGLIVLVILGPLVMFTPQLTRAKRRGAAEYDVLANRYILGFEEKWIRPGVPEASEILGTGDIQSLADMGNSYSVVREMRIVPFRLSDVGYLAVTTGAPLLPLALTVLPFEELVRRLVKLMI